ncbi:MAG: putative adenylyltransferase/sulfurtransferase MoeZ [Alphaproteobacteria bacterium MarineAlpha4_Bin2]|nr:MAG: putative adenylyltransferase/sulfurtransferase MoeZ [Alphaproteobacteria bacterium MarineAlpha4_Bin2]|tara:strand:+ start:16 stop:819 length:804 start_codon:yes stop_codon:yes gene_type:complete
MDEISDEQLMRYARHIVLDEVGEEGQIKLLESSVLVIGAGGLGSPVLMYLAAAGVGTLGVVDDDVVDVTNLQRQIVHGTDDINRPKVESAAARLLPINPEITVNRHPFRIVPENALELIGQYDLVLDGSDNFDTRYMINDACYISKTPLVSAALLRFEGQITTIKAYEGEDAPCYRCIFPRPPAPGMVPRCEQAGIFGSVAGVLGTMQATEALKELLGLGRSLSGRLILYDAMNSDTRSLKVHRDPACALCGDNPTINGLGLAEATD